MAQASSPTASLDFRSADDSSNHITVVLQIDSGSFRDGFWITLRILDNGKIVQEDGSFLQLPAAPDIPLLFQQWQTISLEGGRTVQRVLDTGPPLERLNAGDNRKLQAVQTQITNLGDWKQYTTALEHECTQWFEALPFIHLGDRIQASCRVRQDQSIPIVIRCETGNVEQDQILVKKFGFVTFLEL